MKQFIKDITTEEKNFLEALAGKVALPDKTFEQKLLSKLEKLEARKQGKSWQVFIRYSFFGISMVFVAIVLTFSLYSPGLDNMFRENQGEVYLASQEEKRQIILSALENSNANRLLEQIFISPNSDLTNLDQLNSTSHILNSQTQRLNRNIAPIESDLLLDQPTSFAADNFINYLEKTIYTDQQLAKCFADRELSSNIERSYFTEEFGGVLEILTEKSSYILFEDGLDFVVVSDRTQARVRKAVENGTTVDKMEIELDEQSDQTPISVPTSYTVQNESKSLFEKLENNLEFDQFDIGIVKIDNEEFYQFSTKSTIFGCPDVNKELFLYIDLDKSSFEPRRIRYLDSDNQVIMQLSFAIKSLERNSLFSKLNPKVLDEQAGNVFLWESNIVDENFLNLINTIPNDLANDLANRLGIQKMVFGEIIFDSERLVEPVRFSVQIGNEFVMTGQELSNFLENVLVNPISYTAVNDESELRFHNLRLKMI